ncbi:MAG: response regulator [Phycisphaerae bacterium]|nr:response regulator [Phycisphaerae bacterium]
MADKAKILIIDDDEDYLASTRALLEGEGYEVIEALTGRAGREVAHKNKPDLIVVDIMMESPVEGYSVVQALRFGAAGTDVGEIPIIMVSAVKDDPSSRFPMAEGMPMITPDAYFTKPLDIPKFLECVQSMLED